MSQACKDEKTNKGTAVPVACPPWKRALDLTLITLSLPLLVPLTILISLWIRVSSGRPILFRQQRVGYLRRPFTCLKFRTMPNGADTTAHQLHAGRLIEGDLPMVKLDSEGDPRLTSFALMLRSSGLDELPQLINVLKGEMSLVGPRPCLPAECEKYCAWQMERFNTAPGLTGLWQVSGKNKTTFNKMIRLDIDYTRTRAPGRDIKIILKTIPVLVIQFCETHQNKKLSQSAAASNRRPDRSAVRGESQAR